MNPPLNMNTRLGARLVVEGVLSNLAFRRESLPLAWKHMHPVLAQCDSPPVRRLAHHYPPGIIKRLQKPVVDLFNTLFCRRGETEVQALQLLADHVERFSSIKGLMFFFKCWEDLIDSRWNHLHGAMFHSSRIGDLETIDAGPLRNVLDAKIDNEGLTKMGLEVSSKMKTAMVAPLIEFARERIRTNTKIAVLSPERSQTDLIVASLLRVYPLLEVARWDGLAHVLRPVTVFGLAPDIKDLRSLHSSGAWCVIDTSGSIVNDNTWDGLIKYLKPTLQFGIGRSNEVHGQTVVARMRDLGLDPDSEPKPGPRIAVALEPLSETKAKPLLAPIPAKAKPKPRAKAKRVPKPKAKRKSKAEPKPNAKPAPPSKPAAVPEPKVAPVPEAKPAPLPEPKAKPEPEPVVIPEPAPAASPATQPAAEPPEAPPTKVSRTLPEAPRYARTIDPARALHAFRLAAAEMAGAIRMELSRGGDIEARRADLRTKFEFEARQHYNRNRPPGLLPARFLLAQMLDQTGDPDVLELMRSHGLKK